MNLRDAINSVFKRRRISQVGHRGFAPRLPLFKINNLEANENFIQNNEAERTGCQIELLLDDRRDN